MSKLFQKVGGLRPRRTAFNLSYDKTFTGDLGLLYPVMCDEVVPGDFFKISNAFHLRFMPIVAPLMHSVSVYVHYFFVPYRLLWGGIKPKGTPGSKDYNGVPVETGSWEDFITGGVDGRTGFPSDDPPMPIPRWHPPSGGYQIDSLWDYLGFPIYVRTPYEMSPIDFPRRAYNFIFNEMYRDQTLLTSIEWTNTVILQRAWKKDYFTASLPFLQRGVSPALPVNISFAPSPADRNFSRIQTYNLSNPSILSYSVAVGNNPASNQGNIDTLASTGNLLGINLNDIQSRSQTTTFDIADVRLAFQIQKWLERNARAGARYIEFLHAHFGVSPRDDRLQRPEYIGGTYEHVSVGEVPQTSTSQSDAPFLSEIQSKQGNIASTAQGNSQGHAGNYHVREYGLIMGIMSVMPKAVYYQGINRQWLRSTKYDFFFPEFANLSEQEVYHQELYAVSSLSAARGVFGFIPRYDEMRYKPSYICGKIRPDSGDLYFSAFTMARDLNAEGDDPQIPGYQISGNFITCNPTKRYLAVPSEPTFACTFANIIKAYRPMPFLAEPGLVDHH